MQWVEADMQSLAGVEAAMQFPFFSSFLSAFFPTFIEYVSFVQTQPLSQCRGRKMPMASLGITLAGIQRSTTPGGLSVGVA